jgi:hypothetical protein
MFNEYVTKAQKQLPSLKIKYKNESLFMRILSFILFFNKDFSTKYVTTIGSTIYYPSKQFIEKNELSASIILMHEMIHIYDSKRLSGILFSFLYLFPQILALLSFLGFINPYFFLFAVCLLPIPALFRSYFEYRAYSISIYASYHMSQKYNYIWSPTIAINGYVNNFVNGNYYFMFPFKSYLIKLFYTKLNIIENGELPLEWKATTMIDSVLK